MLGRFLRDVVKLNQEHAISASSVPMKPSRIGLTLSSKSPIGSGTRDESANDEFLAPDGQVMEMLSEHQCEGWLEGYLLTGRHGLFNSYEAFIHIVDSMFNQHAKWLKVSPGTPLAAEDRFAELLCWPRTSGSRITTALRTRIPAFIDHVINKKAEIVRVYLAARCQLPAVGHGSLPAQPALRQRGGGRQACGAAMADHGRSHRALHEGHRHLAMGQQRPERRAGRGDGLLRRRAHAGDPGRRFHPARVSCPS